MGAAREDWQPGSADLNVSAMVSDTPEPRAGEAARQETAPASAAGRTSEPEAPVSSLSALGELATSMAPPSLRALAPLGLLLIAVVGVLYLARSVFIPLTFALMLSFLLSPIVTKLSRITR